MTKRRPSIKGRGAEILFGEPPPPVEPSPSETEPIGAELVAELLPAELETLLPEAESMAMAAESEPEQLTPDEGEALPQMIVPGGDLPTAVTPDVIPDIEDLPDLLPIVTDAIRDLHGGQAAGEETEPPIAAAVEPPSSSGPAASASPPAPAQDEPGSMPADENLPDEEPVPADSLRDAHLATGEQPAEPQPAAPPETPVEAVPAGPGPVVEAVIEERPATPDELQLVPPAVVAAGEGEPTAGEPAPAEPVPTGGSAALDQADIESALYEEARDGEPDAGPPEDTADTGTTPPATPEMESAFLSEAIAAEEPPEPVADTPIPTMEATMEEQNISADTAIHVPPPPDTTGDAAGSVVPPRPPRTFFDLPTAESIATEDVQAAGGGVVPIEVTAELTPEEQKKLLARLGGARLSKLDREIDRTYQRVAEVVGDNADLATECYNLLLKARDIILRRDATRIAQAEYYVEQSQVRLRRAEDSMRGAHAYQWRILAWGGVWFAVFMTILVLMGQPGFRNAVAPTPTADSALDMRVFIPAMLWGGIGGVTAVLYSLFKHVGLRDFDTAFNLSYVGKPFLGLILGAAVYMVFHLLMRTLGILPAGLQGGEQVDAIAVSPWIIFLVAWAGGFKENRVFDLVDRVMKQIFSGSEATPPAAPGPEQPGTPS